MNIARSSLLLYIYLFTLLLVYMEIFSTQSRLRGDSEQTLFRCYPAVTNSAHIRDIFHGDP